jgi:hypothetical protein
MYGYNYGRHSFNEGNYCRGYGQGFGYGFGGGPGRNFGMRHRGFGAGYADFEYPVVNELDAFKRYKDHLELRRKDLDAEIDAVNNRISDLEK